METTHTNAANLDTNMVTPYENEETGSGCGNFHSFKSFKGPVHFPRTQRCCDWSQFFSTRDAALLIGTDLVTVYSLLLTPDNFLRCLRSLKNLSAHIYYLCRPDKQRLFLIVNVAHLNYHTDKLVTLFVDDSITRCNVIAL
jgi:hypothetical protein